MNRDQPRAPAEAGAYSLEMVVRITGVGRETLAEYCAHGLLPLATDELETAAFDDRLVCDIRRIVFLREQHGINLAGIRIIHELQAEVERLRRELQFVREAGW